MLSAYEQERRWRRIGGKLHMHVDAGSYGGGDIYKSTAGVMDRRPDVCALTLATVFQDVAFAPAPQWISVPTLTWHRCGASSKQGSRATLGERAVNLRWLSNGGNLCVFCLFSFVVLLRDNDAFVVPDVRFLFGKCQGMNSELHPTTKNLDEWLDKAWQLCLKTPYYIYII